MASLSRERLQERVWWPATLCAIVFAATGYGAQGGADVEQPVVVRDFTDLGIALTPSTAAGFDARMAALIPNWSAMASAMKPFLAILSNETTRTIVAYSISFQTTDRLGRGFQHSVHFNYPIAVAGAGLGDSGLPSGREVRPGEKRVIGWDFEVVPDADNRWLADLAKEQSVKLDGVRLTTITIDAAILDDGSLIGEETSELQEAFEKYLTATQTIMRAVLSRIEAGTSVNETFQWLRETASQARYKAIADRDAFYYVQAAGDISRARNKLGDERVRGVLEKAVRRAPFVVKRHSPR